ncbi:hypothetical protein KFE25_013212 [Diacronema lutheri]|uniref:Uncharacterized protein n=1 Tax=Diacronema lutheri TaxID=2081491 RepID=A0A8J5XGL7_DIALT|nr:hypothetical protein KFE25_013212 [Diacronema lutheri]
MRGLPASARGLLLFTLGFVLSPIVWFPWLQQFATVGAPATWPDGAAETAHRGRRENAHTRGGGGGSGGSGGGRRATLPARHPEFRLALVVPWLGASFPPWFAYFLTSCGRSAFLADWLIFHEGANWSEAAAYRPVNVHFHDLGPSGLSFAFGTSLARALNLSHETGRLVRLFDYSFRQYTYIVTEYKPTLGVVFAPYLDAYTHWSYTDLDIVMGDLPRFVERDELRSFDIVSYSFGDHQRLYLRGQFAMHKNEPWINLLFAQCEHLGAGLLRELAFKAATHRKMSEEAANRGKAQPRVRFISAEGCYSAAVYATPSIRVKIANKFFADFGLQTELAVVDGSVRQCPPTDAALRAAGLVPRARRAPCALGADADADDDAAAARDRAHSIELPGVHEIAGPLVAVAQHGDCSRWVDERWRVCANLTNGGDGSEDDLLFLNGSLFRRARRLRVPDRRYDSGAFFHFQTWKGAYKRHTLGQSGHMRWPNGSTFVCSGKGIYSRPEWAPARSPEDEADARERERGGGAPTHVRAAAPAGWGVPLASGLRVRASLRR